jgi:hypothetical protein
LPSFLAAASSSADGTKSGSAACAADASQTAAAAAAALRHRGTKIRIIAALPSAASPISGTLRRLPPQHLLYAVEWKAGFARWRNERQG